MTIHVNRFTMVLYRILIELYLKFDSLAYRLKLDTDEANNRYYDHWGRIDTLGNTSAKNCLVSSYSDELTSYFAFHFVFWVTCCDNCGDKYIYISIKAQVLNNLTKKRS